MNGTLKQCIVTFLEVRNIIERQSFKLSVHFVNDVQLLSSEGGAPFTSDAGDGDYVMTQAPDEVLVAARRHQIDLISEIEHEEESTVGINFLRVGVNFIVSAATVDETVLGLHRMQLERNFKVAGGGI